jgi:hypothetical protein
VLDFAQQERKGRERADIPRRPAKGGATPVSSPLGKKAAERERQRERDREGRRERGTCVRRSAARREAHDKPTNAAGGMCASFFPPFCLLFF